jgi:hypothetical protein
MQLPVILVGCREHRVLNIEHPHNSPEKTIHFIGDFQVRYHDGSTDARHGHFGHTAI